MFFFLTFSIISFGAFWTIFDQSFPVSDDKDSCFKIETPAKFAEAAKILHFVANLPYFPGTHIRTFSHTTVVIIRKLLVHKVLPSLDEPTFEAPEREGYPIACNAFDTADNQHDFDCLFYDYFSNVVVFIFVSHLVVFLVCSGNMPRILKYNKKALGAMPRAYRITKSY